MNARGGRSEQQDEALKRLWGNVPVVEAKGDIRVAVLPRDAKGSTPGNEQNCLLARACKRQFGTSRVVFLRTVAYVEIPDENGTPRVERFMIPRAAQKLIRDFDLHHEIKSGAAFVLRAPQPSETAEAQRQAYKRHRTAILRGEAVREKNGARAAAAKKSRANRIVRVGDNVLRDGTGLVQFKAA